jgi:hypothetical protein
MHPALRCVVCGKASVCSIHDPGRDPTFVGCYCGRHARDYVRKHPGSSRSTLPRVPPEYSSRNSYELSPTLATPRPTSTLWVG